MNKIAQDHLAARASAKQAVADGEECYIPVAMGAARGVFTDLEKAKEELRLAKLANFFPCVAVNLNFFFNITTADLSDISLLIASCCSQPQG